MNARHAYGFFYRQVVARCDEDDRLEVDKILFNDPAIDAELQRRRRQALMAMGAEVAG